MNPQAQIIKKGLYCNFVIKQVSKSAGGDLVATFVAYREGWHLNFFLTTKHDGQEHIPIN